MQDAAVGTTTNNTTSVQSGGENAVETIHVASVSETSHVNRLNNGGMVSSSGDCDVGWSVDKEAIEQGNDETCHQRVMDITQETAVGNFENSIMSQLTDDWQNVESNEWRNVDPASNMLFSSAHDENDRLKIDSCNSNWSVSIRRHKSAKEQSRNRRKIKPVMRCKSSSDKTLSDGIVMRPIIASICPGLADNVINASLPFNFLNSPTDNGTFLYRSGETLSPHSHRDETVQTSYQILCGIENGTQTSNVDRFLSSSTVGDTLSVPRRLSLSDDRRKLSDVSEVDKPIFHSHSSFKHSNNNSNFLYLTQNNNPANSSDNKIRLFHSCENLEKASCPANNVTDRSWSSRSPQLTSRQFLQLRNPQYPENTRAFILHHLVDRKDGISEVTV